MRSEDSSDGSLANCRIGVNINDSPECVHAGGAQAEDVALQLEHPSVEATSTCGIPCKVRQVNDYAIGQGIKDRSFLESEWRCRVLPGHEQQQGDNGRIPQSTGGTRGGQYQSSRDPGRERDDIVIGRIENCPLEAVCRLASVADVGVVVVDIVHTKHDYEEC